MKKRFRALVGMLLATTLTVSTITGCGGTDGDKQASSSEKKDNLVITVGSDFGDFSPFSTSSSAVSVTYQIYEPLFNAGYDMEITPGLAESWEQIDSTHYTLKIRQGATDSAGNKFTAKDAVYTLNEYGKDAQNSGYVQNVDLEKTVASDEYTLELYFLEPNMYTFMNLSTVKMFTQAAWEASTDKMVTDPVGTGPYVLADFVSGSYAEVKARDDYWGGKPEMQTARFNVISEPSQATTALETGEADLVMKLQASDVDYINGKDGLTTLVDPGVQSMMMFFNMSESSVFKNKDLRQALCFAIDNAAINTVAYGGLATPSVCPFSTEMTDYVKELDGEMYLTFDMDKAKALIKKSGLSGGNIKIATDGSSQETAIAEIVQNTLIDLGFTVEINNYDSATIWDIADDASQWDLILNMGASPSGYGLDKLKAFLGFLNWSQWSGAEYDKFMSLCDSAIRSETEEDYTAKEIEAVQLVKDMVPVYTLVQLSNIYAFKDNLNFKVWNRDGVLVKELKFE
ncbi:ABC transporter substrate-binding protein [uncultured Robinsoniella sp.]|uniref:ABC transporter substrate-binding protein n=1 Tax=uncultured Robinsoniella sp. TaxID=904190 RepID=UPI00374EB5DD